MPSSRRVWRRRGGTAIADILGRLPTPQPFAVTYTTGVEQLPPFEDYSMATALSHFKGKPLYSFGYGLSYATFSL